MEPANDHPALKTTPKPRLQVGRPTKNTSENDSGSNSKRLFSASQYAGRTTNGMRGSGSGSENEKPFSASEYFMEVEGQGSNVSPQWALNRKNTQSSSQSFPDGQPIASNPDQLPSDNGENQGNSSELIQNEPASKRNSNPPSSLSMSAPKRRKTVQIANSPASEEPDGVDAEQTIPACIQLSIPAAPSSEPSSAASVSVGTAAETASSTQDTWFCAEFSLLQPYLSEESSLKKRSFRFRVKVSAGHVPPTPVELERQLGDFGSVGFWWMQLTDWPQEGHSIVKGLVLYNDVPKSCKYRKHPMNQVNLHIDAMKPGKGKLSDRIKDAFMRKGDEEKKPPRIVYFPSAGKGAEVFLAASPRFDPIRRSVIA